MKASLLNLLALSTGQICTCVEAKTAREFKARVLDATPEAAVLKFPGEFTGGSLTSYCTLNEASAVTLENDRLVFH